MFRCGVLAIFTSIALAVATSHAQTLSLTSDATNLNALTVGQTVTFSVHLDGLDTKELDSLVAAVFYDDGLLCNGCSVV